MQPTPIRRALFGARFVQSLLPKPQPAYNAYKSKFGPSYKIQPNWHGISLASLNQYTFTIVGFTGAAGIFAVFFFGEVPRVKQDILQKVPIIGDHFIREIPADENPF